MSISTVGLLAIASISVFAAETTACGVVTPAEAEKFIGAPLDVNEQAIIPVSNGPGAYNSVCTYIARGADFANPFGAPRALDLTLRFLHNNEAMAFIFDNSVAQYSVAIQDPNSPFKNGTINFLQGLGEKAFALEAVVDGKSGYKFTLIVFYRGKVGGSVAAWRRPDSSLELTKAVAKHVLSKLP